MAIFSCSEISDHNRSASSQTSGEAPYWSSSNPINGLVSLVGLPSSIRMITWRDTSSADAAVSSV
ncbi:hypothetical protein [Nocardia sp. NPDC004722]